MREIFVTDLVKEILGPRGDSRESLKDSPLSEYITGVLSPQSEEYLVPEILDDSPESVIPESDVQELPEDDAYEPEVQSPLQINPVLSPKSLPSSFGLAFCVKSDSDPMADVCLTWARYHREGDIWRREPRYTIIPSLILRDRCIYRFDSSGKRVMDEDLKESVEISFHVVSEQIYRDTWMLRMYFVNSIKLSESQNSVTEYHIFQPQIRVIFDENTHLIPIEGISGKTDGELQELAFLYRDRPVMARGYLCAAVWEEIDPARRFDVNNLDFPESCNYLPFHWTDGDIIPDDERERFGLPHIRTEFTPIYSMPFPDFSWDDEKYGNPPELRAKELAELYMPDELKKAIIPVCEGYRKWISEKKEELKNFSDETRGIADRILKRCDEILGRMGKSIELLINCEDERLAFCFANRAMNMQSEWTRKSPLIWYPFQLGYILTVLESLANPDSPDRDICDLLWVPTGGGKTESYLFLVVFALALRRLRARKSGKSGAGVTVIMRYTLRLLTIQQFRRLLSAITACEYMRVENLRTDKPVGWRPGKCNREEQYLWGTEPFGAGLWVGGGVTPNRLGDTPVYVNGRSLKIPGAVSILKGGSGEGEPAQVLNCPACGSILAIPDMGITGKNELHLVVKSSGGEISPDLFKNLTNQGYGSIRISDPTIHRHQSREEIFTITLTIESSRAVSSRDIDRLWEQIENRLGKVELMAVRASRPGYFSRYYYNQKGRKIEYDFQIFCPNPSCPLNSQPQQKINRYWCAGAPLGWITSAVPQSCSPTGGVRDCPDMEDSNRFIYIPEPFRVISPYLSDRIPIPAYTVDEQIYHRIPSVIISTVDKFARPAFEPRASSIFGNLDHYHCIWGYYRAGSPPLSALTSSYDCHPGPVGTSNNRFYTPFRSLDPPELIIQDELHLIDGPLGSLTGFYETAIAHLCEETGKKIKYIASTATIKNADMQVSSLFLRKLSIFPPHGLTASDRFFLREEECHPFQDSRPGRLYLGVCAPGRGPLTPMIRICSRLLQTAEVKKDFGKNIDNFWTLTLYFNSIRELGGIRALFRQDIPERLKKIARYKARKIYDDKISELSSRINSTDLPAVLNLLSASFPNAQDALLTTSMFGTGIDISRISLMVVDGQPKTTSSYIQSTGRVGRSTGALVVTLFRASRPRDLSHYEFFCGYHRQIHRYVEPVTVYPFAPGVLERASGPLCVFLLRNMRSVSQPWHRDDSPFLMAKCRNHPDVLKIPEIIKIRAQYQPDIIHPDSSYIEKEIKSCLDRWYSVTRKISRNELKYVEYAISERPKSHVVLGDSQHRHSGFYQVYENAPQSLRDIEDTCGFEV